MNIIVGATGQIGSVLIDELYKKGFPVRAVVRNHRKLKNKNLEFRTVNLFDQEQLTNAFEGGTVAFILTPENPGSNDIIRDARIMIKNYAAAINKSSITKVVALSSMGANAEGKTGNLIMSQLLENELDKLDVDRVIVRSSYFYSNWMGYLSVIREHGILPTFFSEHHKIEMNSPIDLALFIAGIMTNDTSGNPSGIMELTGPEKYSSVDIAKTFSSVLNQDVSVQTIPPDKWMETLTSVGFTENAATNLSDMTQTVIENKIVPEFPENIHKLPTTFEDYLKDVLIHSGEK